MFELDRSAILEHPRLRFLTDLVPVHEHLDNIEKFIRICFEEQGWRVAQAGRVVALRATDQDRLSSAFKASLYLGKYNDMANRDRFLRSMVAAGHSYEPIRGETVLFLYIGVAKPVYDHLITYTVGRPTRIAGGQRANVPWGFELPVEARHPEEYEEELERIREVIRLAKQERTEQMQAARAKLPVGYVMPPFLLEFSEEALIKHVFRQRLFERGAQGATVEVVSDMLKACLAIDEEKWTFLIEYHGPHIQQWQKAMRTLRKERLSLRQLAEMENLSPEEALDADLYDLLMATVGKLPPSMWDRMR
ncbi:hypothetical protein [Alicyclobacillus acidocaldarius]|uniref:Uncharacterized protein n=1 Tax=Alicyclobacillus acidocaldarius subsp. acidocaldarius (strain ATCC 27009 / DSM 446 / BCRC 14685 / JCM 5260 / KCTC 1825 / NBRC 15652 / NCIMB 11725 / NRRL B-14509 / 104-IA) TaxID=521098 RepID=C8WV00_ALIAD|nr:hypothetical protein [Alicyclobacillus acidocaldarius]ACV57989.1 hypothetical protein Aaci_0949 [Alicyclobacillus acidocaldarius subsp. acidocaldarius DSM 446]